MRSKDFIKEDISEKQLFELGYTYAMMEGGYVSKDCATIIIDNRDPYNGQIQQWSINMESEHSKNLENLKNLGYIRVITE